MSIAIADLLGLASDLVALSPTTEVGCRAAVSRAYYAAYHDSDDWHTHLPVPGFLPADFVGGTHAKLFHRLANPDTTLPPDQKMRSKRRSYILRTLHGHRIQADYFLTETVDVVDSRQAIQDASTIIAIV